MGAVTPGNERKYIHRRIHGEGITILVVEQKIRHALEITSRGYVLENGHIVLSGASQQFLGNDYT